MSKWIKCDERLPDIEDDVLVYDGLFICVAYRVESQYLNLFVPWVLDYERQYLCRNPTHWMPLPQLPDIITETD